MRHEWISVHDCRVGLQDGDHIAFTPPSHPVPTLHLHLIPQELGSLQREKHDQDGFWLCPPPTWSLFLLSLPTPQLLSRERQDTLSTSLAPPKLPGALWPLSDLTVQSEAQDSSRATEATARAYPSDPTQPPSSAAPTTELVNVWVHWKGPPWSICRHSPSAAPSL